MHLWVITCGFLHTNGIVHVTAVKRPSLYHQGLKMCYIQYVDGMVYTCQLPV